MKLWGVVNNEFSGTKPHRQCCDMWCWWGLVSQQAPRPVGHITWQEELGWRMLEGRGRGLLTATIRAPSSLQGSPSPRPIYRGLPGVIPVLDICLWTRIDLSLALANEDLKKKVILLTKNPKFSAVKGCLFYVNWNVSRGSSAHPLLLSGWRKAGLVMGVWWSVQPP